MLKARQIQRDMDKVAFTAALDSLQEAQDGVRAATDALTQNLRVNGVILSKISNQHRPPA